MIKQLNDNLQKDDELELGRLIQEGEKAKAKLKENENLTHDEILELEETIHIGDEAYGTLVGNYINLARSIAHKHHKRTSTRYPIEDIIQDAILALCEATKTYDPSRNCKLGTHAFYAITKKVSTKINEARLVRMPENRMGQYLSITRAEKEYNDLPSDSTDREMSERDYVLKVTEMSSEDYNLIKENMQPTVSLNATVKDSGREMGEMIADESYESSLGVAYEEVSIEDLSIETQSVLSKLDSMEQDLIAYEFGAFKPSMQYSEFLVKYNMTDKDVTRLTRRAIRKMQKIAEEV